MNSQNKQTEIKQKVTIDFDKYSRLLYENRSLKKRLKMWKKIIKAIRDVCKRRIDNYHKHPEYYDENDIGYFEGLEKIYVMTFAYNSKNKKKEIKRQHEQGQH